MSVLGHLTPPKILTLAAAAAIASLGIAITSTEASGDPFGDLAVPDGAITGVATDAVGDADTAFVEIGGPGGGSLTVSFDDNVVFDGPGDDLTIHVVADASIASASLEVSDDGTNWVPAGTILDGADVGVDLGPLGLTFATAVRISQPDGADPYGFNLDAVTANNFIDLEDLVIGLAPATASLEGGTEHEVVTTVSDGSAVPNVPVEFRVVAGPNLDEHGDGTTDIDGHASFAWTGNGVPGDDTVEAWLDIDGDGTRNGSEPFASAMATWNGATGTVEIVDVDGGGLVSGDLVQVTVTDADLDVSDGADTVTVQVFSTSDGTGFSLELTETGAHTGVFTATFSVGDATDATDATALVLAVVPGDDVTARYEDELDGTGASATVEATVAVVETEARTDKVTVCHRPPGNPGNAHTIEVGGQAHLAHLAHGDDLGECVETPDGTTTKHEQQLEAFCERKGDDHPRCEDPEAETQSLSVTEDDDAAEQASASDDQEDEGPGHGNSKRPDKKPAHAGGPGANQD